MTFSLITNYWTGHGSAQCTSCCLSCNNHPIKRDTSSTAVSNTVCQQRCMSLPAVFPCFSHILQGFSEVICFQQMILIC
uniref:Bm7783 n=1 Tax=Brugia malayi TaxID=6279 RepID=A0A0H5BRR7_BRUMA|nr:Bm7783 [Brugia malayi]